MQEKHQIENQLPEQWIADPSTLFLVCFSGGKDSVATVLHLLEIGIHPTQIELHHQDVDGGSIKIWDWPCTHSYCEAVAHHFQMPLYTSYREGGIHREILRTSEGLQDVILSGLEGFFRFQSQDGNRSRLKFPAQSASLTTRWCSGVIKIDVFARVITQSRHYKGRPVIVCTGERREESPNRARYKPLEWHRTHTHSRRVLHWRPVLDYTEGQVWDTLKRYNVQPHPAYCLGFSRCSCLLCIFSSPNTWASIHELSPASIAYLNELEEALHFTLHRGKSILQVVANGKSFLKAANVTRWKEEALSDFHSPLIVRNWQLPQGAGSTERAGSL